MTDLISLRFLNVVHRNYLVWRKLLVPSLMGNLADPLIWFVGFGMGFGAFMPDVQGVPYLTFLATGMICYTTMYSASFEALYSAFARLKTQRTWEGLLYTPMTIRDLVLGEWTWAAIKGVISGAAILLVAYALGLIGGWRPLAVLPAVFLTGLAFSGMALVMTALAQSYDFFVYYFTLLITPMMLVSGVFFPTTTLPEAVKVIAQALPLLHATELARSVTLGQPLERPLMNFAVLTIYALAGVLTAAWLTRRRLMR